ncbi:hypothetical protein ABPG74_018514 [Tetrahymena malaccensis]
MKSLISTNYNQNTECFYDDQNFDESNHQFQQMKLRYSLEKPSLNNNSYQANLKEKGLNECKNTKLAWKILEQYHNKSIYLKAKAYMAAQNNKQLFYEMLFKLVLNYLQPTEIFKLLQVSRQFRDNKFKPIIESRMEFLITNENVIYYQSMFNYAMQIDSNRKLLAQQFQHFSKLKNEYEEVIHNDVERTFQDQEFFKSARNKSCLNQILKALSSSNQELGYIQGINYIAAILLSIMPPEETYWVTKQILEKYNLASLFLDQFQNLELFTFQASCFFKNFIPDLFNHMKIFSVQYEITIQRWVLSFFANDVDVQLMIKILNLFIFKGFKVIIKAVIALLSVHKKNILQIKSQEEIYEYLQEKISEQPVSHVLFLREMKKFKVTRRLLEECGIKYKKCKNNQIPLFELIKTHHGTLEWFNNFGTNSPVSTTKHKTRQKRCTQSNNILPNTRERIFTTDSARDLINKSQREKNSNNGSLLNLSGQRNQDQQLSSKREHSITYADSISYNKANQILTLKKYSSRDIYENNSYKLNYLQNAQDIQRIDSYRHLELQKTSEQNNTRRNGIKYDSNENDRNQDLKMQALLQPSTSESEDEKTNKPLDSQLNHQSFKEFRSITSQSIFNNHKVNQNQQFTSQNQNLHASLQQQQQPNKQPQIITVNLKYPSNNRENIPSLQKIEQNNSFFVAKNQLDLNFQKKQSNSYEQSDNFKIESTSYKNLPIDQNNVSSALISSKQLIEHAISQGNLSYRENQLNGGKSLTPRGNGKDGLEINYLKFLKQNIKNQATGQEPESYNPGRFFKDHLKIQEEIKKKLETDSFQIKSNPNQLNISINSQQNTNSNQNLTSNSSKLKQRPERELSANSLVNTSSNNSNNNNLNAQATSIIQSTSNNQNSLNQMTYSNYLQLNQSLSSNQIEKIKDIYKQNYNKMQHQQQQNYSSASNSVQTANQNSQQPQIIQDLTIPQERLHPSYSMHSNEEVILSRKHAYSMFGNTPDSQNTPQSQIQAGSFSSAATLHGIHSQNYNQQSSNTQMFNKDINNLNQIPQQIQKSYSQMSMYSIPNQSKQQNTQLQFSSNNIPNNQINSSIQTQQNMPSIFQQITNQPNHGNINNQYVNNHNNSINNSNNNQIINNNSQISNSKSNSSNINQVNNMSNNQASNLNSNQVGINIYSNQINSNIHSNQISNSSNNNQFNNIAQQPISMQNQNSNSNLIKPMNLNTFNQNKLNGNIHNSSSMIQVSAYSSNNNNNNNNNKNNSNNNSNAPVNNNINNNQGSQSLSQNQLNQVNKSGNYSNNNNNNSQSTTNNNMCSIQLNNYNTKNNKQQLQQQQQQQPQQQSQAEQYNQILNNNSSSNNNNDLLQINKTISQQNSLNNFNNSPLSQNQNLQNQSQPSSQNTIIQNQIQSKIQYNQQQIQLPQQYSQSGQTPIQNNNLNQLFQNSKLGLSSISNQAQQQYPLTISGNSSQLGQQQQTFQMQQYNNQNSSQSLQKPQSSQSQQSFCGVNQQINSTKVCQQNQNQQIQSSSPMPSSYQLQSQYQSNSQYKFLNNSNQPNKQNLLQNGGYQSPMDQKQKQQLQNQVKANQQAQQNSQNNGLQLNSNSQSQFNSLTKNLKNESVSPSEENKQVQKQDIQNIIQLQLNQNQSKFLKVNSYQNAKPQNQNSTSQINQAKKLQTTTINSNKNFGIHLLSQNNGISNNSNSNAPSSNKFQALFFQNQQNQQQNQQINQSTQLSNNVNNIEKISKGQKIQLNSQTNSNYNSNQNNATSNAGLNAFQQQIQSNQHQFVSLILNQQKQSQFNEDQNHLNNPSQQQIMSQNINQNISSTNSHLQKLQERKKQAKFTSFSLTQSEMGPIIQSKVQAQQQQQISQNPSLYLN